MILMDFSGTYRYQSFYKNSKYDWIDCSDIEGTQYYCDMQAESLIKQKIESYSANGVHFIDSGNYHYVSKLWIDKIDVPFVLVLLDHHPDMQPAIFEQILSCGSWVKDVLDSNALVKNVMIIGADDHLVANIDNKYHNSIEYFGANYICNRATWNRFATIDYNLPLYISLDKDILSTDSAVSDWDNGTMDLNILTSILDIILHNHKVIGIDICGECSNLLRLMTDTRTMRLNNRSNRLLCDCIYLAQSDLLPNYDECL